MDYTLVVMAAGLGSRYGSLKQMEPVGPNGEFIIDYSVYDAICAGFNKIVFVIRKDFFEDFKETIGKRLEGVVKVEYVFQELYDLPLGYKCPKSRVKPWGTGAAIYSAADNIDGNFAIINADDFYGSDFTYMLDVVHVITDKGRHSCEEIIQPSIHYNPEHTPNITDVELDCYDYLDDGVTWAESWLRHPALDPFCVCYAIHDICTHKPYSIPDLLRLNDFWSEAKLVCQHIVQQDGTRWDRNA